MDLYFALVALAVVNLVLVGVAIVGALDHEKRNKARGLTLLFAMIALQSYGLHKFEAIAKSHFDAEATE